LEHPLDFIGRYARAIVGNYDFDGLIAAVSHCDRHLAFSIKGLARVLEDIDENLREMLALHQERRQMRRVTALPPDAVLYRSRKCLFDRLIYFVNQVQPFHMALAELGVP